MRKSGPGRARALAVTLVGVLGCASALVGGAPATAAGAPSAGADTAGVDTSRADPPVVQIRELPASPEVTVVAWSPENTAYGLRAQVNRDGVLRGTRLGDHSLYVSAVSVQVEGGFNRAWVVPVPPGPVLLHSGPMTDRLACNRGDTCAPMSIVSVQMPDDLLRQHRDSLVVTFSGGKDGDWTVTLDRALIDAYLRTVDSVTAAVRVR